MSEIDWLNKVQKNFQTDKDVLRKKSSYIPEININISQQQQDAINRSHQLIQQAQMNQQEQLYWRGIQQRQQASNEQIQQQMRTQQQAAGLQTIIRNPFGNW